MPTLTNIGTWSSPSSVSIFAQTPGIGFVAFQLSLIPIPQANRVRLDLAETEDFERNYTIPRNPIERLTGQNKIKEPDRLSVTGMLSAHPLQSPLEQAGIARMDKRELAKLRTLLDRKELLFIVTPERMYKNMLCVRLHERYDDTTGKGVALSMDFEEMEIVTPGLVESVLDLDSLGTGTGSETDLGPQTPSTTADPGGLG